MLKVGMGADKPKKDSAKIKKLEAKITALEAENAELTAQLEAAAEKEKAPEGK